MFAKCVQSRSLHQGGKSSLFKYSTHVDPDLSVNADALPALRALVVAGDLDSLDTYLRACNRDLGRI